MKLAVAFLVVTALAFVCAEPCTNHRECNEVHHITICHGHTHVACNLGQCECSDGPMHDHSCSGDASTCSDVQCRDNHNAHCIDGFCQCTMPNQGGHGQPPNHN